MLEKKCVHIDTGTHTVPLNSFSPGEEYTIGWTHKLDSALTSYELS